MAGRGDHLMFFAILLFLLVALCNQAPVAEANKYKGPKNYSFYMHNTLRNFTNENFTAIVTAEPVNLDPKYKQFGMVIVFENQLTQTASNTSQNQGVGRGFFMYDSQAAHIMFMVFTAVIQNEKYNGTIDIIGQNPTNVVGYRYLSVIGGTGDFLLARGLAKLRFMGATQNQVDQQTTWVVSFELDLY